MKTIKEICKAPLIIPASVIKVRKTANRSEQIIRPKTVYDRKKAKADLRRYAD